MEELSNNKDLESMFRELLDKSLKNMEEERDLSLERYRRQDESIISPEDFVLQGKFAVDYLKVAADRSNAMISVAKMIKDIIYKDGSGDNSSSNSGSLNDNFKKEIFQYLQTGKNKSGQ
jgi:hypothetical protein